MQVKRFTVVTAFKDASRRALETAASIVGQRAVQSGRASLQYLVFDAGSDGMGEQLRRQLGRQVEVRIERDRGLYEAIAKGLGMADGDVVSYLNAGDVYHPSAFDVVADVMEAHPVRWVTGMQVLCNEALHVVGAEVPFRYRRDLLLKGLYGRKLPFLQQEATFWARSLQANVDLTALGSLRLAGDYYLWRCFIREEEPAVVAAYLGGFTVHRRALSSNLEEYFREVEALADPPGPIDGFLARCERWRWRNLTQNARKRRNPRLFFWDEEASRWG
jgi:hypothetical protein